jgi:hypothetical protein
MKYMILLYASQQDYEAMQGKSAVKKAWTGEQLGAMGAFMEKFHQEIAESGELVDAHGLDAPVHTRRIQMRGGAPVVTDGPYPEAQEVLAGYTIVDCAGFDRATEIAASISQCPPGPEGAEGLYVDVRPIIEGREYVDV